MPLLFRIKREAPVVGLILPLPGRKNSVSLSQLTNLGRLCFFEVVGSDTDSGFLRQKYHCWENTWVISWSGHTHQHKISILSSSEGNRKPGWCDLEQRGKSQDSFFGGLWSCYGSFWGVGYQGHVVLLPYLYASWGYSGTVEYLSISAQKFTTDWQDWHCTDMLSLSPADPGGPGDPASLAPKKSCIFQALLFDTPYFEQILGSGPSGVKTPLGPPPDQNLGSAIDLSQSETTETKSNILLENDFQFQCSSTKGSTYRKKLFLRPLNSAEKPHIDLCNSWTQKPAALLNLLEMFITDKYAYSIPRPYATLVP